MKEKRHNPFKTTKIKICAISFRSIQLSVIISGFVNSERDFKAQRRKESTNKQYYLKEEHVEQNNDILTTTQAKDKDCDISKRTINVIRDIIASIILDHPK